MEPVAPRRDRRGAVLVPEGRRILTDLTLRDNLWLGGYSRTDPRA